MTTGHPSRGGGETTMRYQIADGIIDYIHLCWLTFLLAPLGAEWKVTSQTPQNGVIFSDGVEEDFSEFNSGAIARIGLADRTLPLVVRA